MSKDLKFKMETPTLPKVPSTILMYKTIKPSIERRREQINALGKSLGLEGGLKGSVDTPEGFSVEEGEHVLEYFKESGAIWYGDMSKLWQEIPEPMDMEKAFGVKEKVEAEEKVKSYAEDFLKRNELIPKEAYLIGTEEAEFTEFKEGEKEIGVTAVSGLQANFGFKLGEIPVVGPGAKISVTYGRDAKVSGFFKAWREVKEDVELPLVPPEKAIEKFQRSNMFVDLEVGSEVIVKKFYLAYYALPVPESQEYLLPVYVVEGETETPDFKYEFTRYVPAVSPEELKKAGILVDPEIFPDPDLM